MRVVPPGADEVPVPPPVTEVPPHDRFCDLVMTGGVASGVVYPWAIVELARAYRFRNIGGTSVGAMAAALAAAAEYGRRVGYDQSFEALRRTPAGLGEVLPDGRTRMLSLFQANASGKRLVKLWGAIFQGRGKARGTSRTAAGAEPPPRPGKGDRWRMLREVGRAYAIEVALGALAGYLLAQVGRASILADVLFVLVGGVAALVYAVWVDVRDGVIDNCLGLCKGGTLEPPGSEGERPGLSDWLNQGIQAGAGLNAKDRPLTFRDLWCAPAAPGAPHLTCADDDPPERRAINLEMVTTNVTHGRPYRLPLRDETSRLFYKPAELRDYFPAVVLDALVGLSAHYAPVTPSDPESIENEDAFRELPGADLPIVVAARLSLSFPLLFSAVPLWAIDYEAAPAQRTVLKRCLFTDGGASSNFPIHLFDAAIPRWPTFGLWLDRREAGRPQRSAAKDEDVWLPRHNREGWADSWIRFDPEASARPAGRRGRAGFGFLRGFVAALATSAIDWHDRTSLRLPHVRNRVARLRLESDEGGLHIGMPRDQILDMAHRYGTRAGQVFVDRFADYDGEPKPAWQEQRWVRLLVLVQGLRERLSGLEAAAGYSAHTVPLASAIARSIVKDPIRQGGKEKRLDPQQAGALETLLDELDALNGSFDVCRSTSFTQVPTPEMRLRAPL